MQNRTEKAVEYFMQGYGCSQSVLLAFADIYGLDETTAKRIAAGFGGGVGRMRMMCGAVSGLVMLAGLEHGQTEGDDPHGKAKCYKFVQDLLSKFKNENGSIICEELLKMNGCNTHNTTHIPDARTAEYYAKRPCAQKVASAACIFEKYIDEKNNER